MKKLFLIICIVIFLSSCNGGADVSVNTTANTTKLTTTSQTTAKKTLFLSEDFLKVDGSTVTIPLTKALALKTSGSDEFIKHNTTHNAYLNLIDKKADIIFVTYPSEEELNLAKQKGIEFEIVPVVKDAFVFLVNINNPVSALTKKQIVDIYSGKITNWKQVKGKDVKIIPYQREKNSGSQSGMLKLVMKDTKLMNPPTELRIEGMDGLVDVIASYDNSNNAIGYSYYYYANLMYVKNSVKFISVDGISPTPQNITSDKYPYTTAYYAVIRKDEQKNSFARKLLEYVLTEAGQNVAAEAKYVRVK